MAEDTCRTIKAPQTRCLLRASQTSCLPGMALRTCHLPTAFLIEPDWSDEMDPLQQAREQWLVFLLYSISKLPSQPMKSPDFQFAFTTAAAEHNTEVLRRYKFQLANAIMSQHQSPLQFGSEFRQVEILEFLCGNHPLWPRLKQYLVQGVSYAEAVPDEHTRISNLSAAIVRGNHVSALKHPEQIQKLMTKDVCRGYVLPLSMDGIRNLQGAELAPLGVAKQFSINEKGEQVQKFRVTLDQSFSPVHRPKLPP